MAQINLTQEIKSINTQIVKLESELKILNEEVKNKQKESSTISNKIKTLKTKVFDLQTNSSQPIVSEHAILRYLERVKGLRTVVKKSIHLYLNTCIIK